MRKAVTLIIFLVAARVCFAQCPFTVALSSKGGLCLGSDTLLISAGGVSIGQIKWANGNNIDTVITALPDSAFVSNGHTVGGGNGAGGNANQLSFPWGLYVDAVGDIYVADAQNERIQQFPAGSTSASNGITVAGGNGTGASSTQFNVPNSIGFDGSGNMYVADAGNNRILKFPSGSTGSTGGVTVAGGNGQGENSNQFNDPYFVFVQHDGTFYVADANNNRVQKFTPGSAVGVTVAGGSGPGENSNQLYLPSCVFVNGKGDIYVADAGNNRVLQFPPGSTAGTSGRIVAGGNGTGNAANQLNGPSSIYVGSNGNLYVADEYNNRVQQFSPGVTQGITVLGGNGVGNAASQLISPSSIFIGPNGSLYVTDQANDRIQAFARIQTGTQIIDTTYIPSAAGTYLAMVTDSAGCTVTTNNITITASVTPAISITAVAAPLPLCTLAAADTVSFTATATNGGTAPAYQWLVNGAAVGTNSTTFTAVLPNASVVSCVLASNAVCATTPTDTSNSYKVKFSSKPVATVTAQGSACLGMDTLVVTPAMGLSTIAWYNGSTLDTIFTAVNNPLLGQGTTVAGGNGAGSAANQLSSPNTISFDVEGNMYVADGGNNRVEKFPPGSTSATNGTVAAGGNGVGTQLNQFNSVSSAYVDASGAIYAGDGANARVLRFPPNSTSATNGTIVAGGLGQGSEAYQLSVPGNVGFDNSGNMYIIDRGNQRVQQFLPGSVRGSLAKTVAGGNGPGAGANQFNIPVFGCVTGDGSIYVADLKNYRVQKFAPGSTAATNGTTVAGGNGPGNAANQLAGPYAVFVDNSGALYVADAINNRIQMFPPGSSASSNGITVASGGNGAGSAANQLDYPEYVYVDGGGNIFVTDENNKRIQKFLPYQAPIDTMFIPITTGTYTAVVTDSAGCADTSNAIIVYGTQKPAVNITADTTAVCAGSPITFSAVAANAGTAPLYLWQVNGNATGPSSPVYASSALADGDVVNCIVTGAPGCFASSISNSIVATVFAPPIVGPASDITISPGESVTLNIAVTGNIAAYLWKPPYGLNDTTVATPVASPAKTTTYTLHVTTANGCTASGTITVKFVYPIGIPSTFTPNGDGRNDVFYILGGYTGDKVKSFTVFNRGGQKVFQVQNVLPNSPAYGWDGNFNALPQPPGTYVYVAVITAADGTEKLFKGTVVLVR